ncbi:DNA polymerase elongation subunit (family B) [Thermoplasmatales archaeon SCGC AB-539-N05]|nr:DNA polymerase elongation subunit (family B) [Thermoplasmatales archaeon SCGC AB-539-N05]
MSDMLLGISPEYLYLHGKPPKRISDYHQPYFLAFCPKEKNIESARKYLLKKLEENTSEENILSKIERIGKIENYRSFRDFNKNRRIFKVYTKKSYFVPEVTNHLFFNYDFYTAEHDIPYQQRALVDLEADGKTWIFDTNGEKKKLKVLVYDIETTQYEAGKTNVPIDMIGHSDFDIIFESEKNLETEEFSFDIIDCPTNWEDMEIKQVVSRNVDEEIENLHSFCKMAMSYDIISGHNIAGFDNLHIYNRLNWILKNYQGSLSDEQKKTFQIFVRKYSRVDKSFHFGTQSEAVQFYPCNLDTYLGVRKFYSFLNEFSLKAVAPFLGIHIKDRLILAHTQIKLDDRTLKYNKHDVQEQLGVTLNLIQQALPLAFTTGMSFDMLLSSGAVSMWDHMSLIRGAVQKKIMPPICRVMSISQALLRDFKECNTSEEIVRKAKKTKEQLSKEFVRVVKYGDEMPRWMEYPYVIYSERTKDPDERLNYHMPGGMTIKPDKDANSHFIPWWYVVVADVGAMYPTILKAMNIGADTVRLASKTEQPDAWIWLKKVSDRLLNSRNVQWRKITDEDSFADKGFMLGVKIDKRPGVVNCAMTGIMSMIAKTKKELKEVTETGNKEELKRLKMMYQSVKGARNAGTHGIISAPSVSGRQFNLWGAATITTKGQIILADTLDYLENKGIRVVYGDTDGIYLGCSRSAGNLPEFSKTLGIAINDNEENWLTKPEQAISAIEQCNIKWQNELNYPDFELEPEIHDGMIFVKHKNYLIFDNKNGKIEMITKGNNFKGSDKANVARKVLKTIMMNVLKENPSWTDEEEARKAIKNSIQNNTKEALSALDLSKVDLSDLTLVQSVQPSKRYKQNQDGSDSTFAKRSKALEKLLGYPIKSRVKLNFVVTKKPLPDITKPSKSGVKPIDYMYPIDLLKDTAEIDLKWYKKMIENYIQGAFGLSDMTLTEQKGLDAWM